MQAMKTDPFLSLENFTKSRVIEVSSLTAMSIKIMIFKRENLLKSQDD